MPTDPIRTRVVYDEQASVRTRKGEKGDRGPIGPEGPIGLRGVGVESASIADDQLLLMLTSGISITAGNVRGPRGATGTMRKYTAEAALAPLLDSDGKSPFAGKGQLYGVSGTVVVVTAVGSATFQLEASLYNDAGTLIAASDPYIYVLQVTNLPDVYLNLKNDGLVVGGLGGAACLAEAALLITSRPTPLATVVGSVSGSGYYGYGY